MLNIDENVDICDFKICEIDIKDMDLKKIMKRN